MRSRYKIVLEGGLYFIASTIVQWIPVFNSEPYFQLIIEAFKHAQKNKALRLYAYVIMENHFHALLMGPSLANTLQSIKSYTSKGIIEKLRIDGKDRVLNQMQFYKKKIINRRALSRYGRKVFIRNYYRLNKLGCKKWNISISIRFAGDM